MPSVTIQEPEPRFAVIVPACNEEECLPTVLRELREILPAENFVVAVGVNGSTDRSAEIARASGVAVGETPLRGYGYGCQAAIDAVDALVQRGHGAIQAYIFVAADGANDPRDIAALVACYQRGAELVIGTRTRTRSNWSHMTLHHVLANRFLGAVCGVLTGRFFSDLGPLRLIDRNLFRRMSMMEWTYGWTIEAQVRAALLRVPMEEVCVRERLRLAGIQKVSHVSWRRTLSVGAQIMAAGVRARFRVLAVQESQAPVPLPVPVREAAASMQPAVR